MTPAARHELARAQSARLVAWAVVNAALGLLFFVLLALDDAAAHGITP